MRAPRPGSMPASSNASRSDRLCSVNHAESGRRASDAWWNATPAAKASSPVPASSGARHGEQSYARHGGEVGEHGTDQERGGHVGAAVHCHRHVPHDVHCGAYRRGRCGESGVCPDAHDLDRERAARAVVAHGVAGRVPEERLAERRRRGEHLELVVRSSMEPTRYSRCRRRRPCGSRRWCRVRRRHRSGPRPRPRCGGSPRAGGCAPRCAPARSWRRRSRRSHDVAVLARAARSTPRSPCAGGRTARRAPPGVGRVPAATGAPVPWQGQATRTSAGASPRISDRVDDLVF